MSKQTKKAPAASLKRRNNGLGLPIHIKKLPILLNIRYYIILPIYSLLYINYIKFPIRIRDFPSDFAYPRKKGISLKNSSLKLKAGFFKNIKK